MMIMRRKTVKIKIKREKIRDNASNNCCKRIGWLWETAFLTVKQVVDFLQHFFHIA
jgi:hypothetical protein